MREQSRIFHRFRLGSYLTFVVILISPPVTKN